MISKHLKIRRLQPEKSRNMFEQIQILKKSRAIVFDFSTFRLFDFSTFRLFAVSSLVFVVEQFRIRCWKANKKNLMISKHLKIGRLQPEKLQNLFE